MNMIRTLTCIALIACPTAVMAADVAPLDVPAKTLPVPAADISPGM
ncbi:hypothetical protein [Lichenifustis flavocetrariae]|uniref:Uncharacterized protein n=1 Tax=Lichenifustis flavocetrariae TaxID=2949735 RepID=A0AA42CK29_9HYPH|nr:hypothetical protein [Lichenifustis flavocetrariae]MCW6508761.1 hypothetical protein [Lichenifustis flavocetrariae]